MADLVANWKQATDAYLKLWQQTVEQLNATPAAGEARREATANMLGAQNAFQQATAEAFEPLVEASGAVPLSEFRRLADDVHTLLLRLDTIDDALRSLNERLARLESPSTGSGAS
ncbi:MAG: hypothetical protein U5Q44_14350 [Dehalococcoidia bacterium]|nr:hypothetical protein [Dehalococcoidia bacterium]